LSDANSTKNISDYANGTLEKEKDVTGEANSKELHGDARKIKKPKNWNVANISTDGKSDAENSKNTINSANIN